MTSDTIRMRQQRTSGERSRAFQLTKTNARRVAISPKRDVEAPTAPNLLGLHNALNKFPPTLLVKNVKVTPKQSRLPRHGEGQEVSRVKSQ